MADSVGEAGARLPRTAADRLTGVTVVAVLAHPDDEVLACGGTLARVADAGARVVLVCASRGELGWNRDPTLLPNGDLGRTRGLELLDSARILDLDEVILLEHPDGCLRWAEGLARDVAGVLRRHRPGIVITFDSDGLYWHEDHVGVHEWTTLAVASLGPGAPPLYYVTLPGGAMRALAEAAHARGGPEPASSLWGISPDAFGALTPPADFRVDVRPWADRKLDALRCHRTQTAPPGLFSWIDASDVRRWLGYELFRRAPLESIDAGALEGLGEAVDGAAARAAAEEAGL